MRRKKPFNPFYVLLLIVGVAFCITACAYGVMTLRGVQSAAASEASESGRQLMDWLDANGFRLMMVEIGLLAICTFAAIATDEYWTKQAVNAESGNEPK